MQTKQIFILHTTILRNCLIGGYKKIEEYLPHIKELSHQYYQKNVNNGFHKNADNLIGNGIEKNDE
jgi:hypothetical protein